MTKIAAIILAAGSSRRYGAENKLLADLNGKTRVRLSLFEGEPTLVLANPNGKHIAVLSLLKGEPYLALNDQDGKTIWKAP